MKKNRRIQIRVREDVYARLHAHVVEQRGMDLGPWIVDAAIDKLVRQRSRDALKLYAREMAEGLGSEYTMED